MLIRHGFKGKLTPRITQQKHFFQLHKFSIPKLIKKVRERPSFVTHSSTTAFLHPNPNHGENVVSGYSFRVDDLKTQAASVGKAEGEI